jgi:hypothetical protein
VFIWQCRAGPCWRASSGSEQACVLFQRIAAVVCFNTARLHSKDSAEDAMRCNMSKNIIDLALAPKRNGAMSSTNCHTFSE